MIGDLVILGILGFIWKLSPKSGVIFTLAFLLYAIMRFFVSFLRIDSKTLFWDLRRPRLCPFSSSLPLCPCLSSFCAGRSPSRNGFRRRSASGAGYRERRGGGAYAAPSVNQKPSRLHLLRRPDCGLCEDMARDLQRLRVDFEEVDIEGDEALERAYGECIPVLLAGEDGDRARASDRTLTAECPGSRRLAAGGTLDA